jgi:hypothetical protein
LATLVLVLFIVAWAAIAFAIVRALAVIFRLQRNLAVPVAVAVAGAFALGAISPFALPSRSAIVAEAPAAAPAAPVADTSHAVTCPKPATVVAKAAPGHLDAVAVGSAAPAAPGASLDVPAGTLFQLGGWIVLTGGPPVMICAIVDGRAVAATTRYGYSRPDVAVALGKPADAPSGFLVTMSVPKGVHTVSVGAVEADARTVDVMQNGTLQVNAQ